MSATGLALRSIEGTLPEKVSAFQQIAASAATSGLMPAGYDSVQKVAAACWAADALAIHPISYMQGVHVAFFNGRVMLEPRWEFIAGLLRARLPGFDFEVKQNDAKACEIVFTADNRKTQTVRYTIEDAARQGFANKDTYRLNPTEMLFKQCFKRGADRIGADVLMGLPPLVEMTIEDEVAATLPDKSSAEVLEAAAASDMQKARPNADAPALVVTQTAPNYIEMLGDLLTDLYGKLSRPDKLSKCSIVMSQIAGTQTHFKRADQIGPVEAKQMYEWLIAKYPTRKFTPGNVPEPSGATVVEGEESALSGAVGDSPEATVDPNIAAAEAAQHADEPVPPPDSEDAPPPVVGNAVKAGVAAKTELYATVDGFLQLGHKAGQALKCEVVKEAPKSSGVWWLVHQDTLCSQGIETSQMVSKHGEFRMEPDLAVRFALELEQAIAKSQRART